MRKLITLMAVCGVLQWAVAQPPGAAGQHQNRAASLLLSQEYAPALSELKQAAALYRAAQDWGHYFACLNQITQTQIDLGRLAAAKNTAKKALWQSIETLGRNNDEAAKASHKLGQVYEAAGRYEDAMQCHKIAYDIREDLFTQQHPKTAESLVHLAITARQQQEYTLAGQYLQAAAESLKQFYQKDHPELATVLEQEGLLFLAAGNEENARASFREAIEILSKFPNQFPTELGRNLCHLASIVEAPEKWSLYERANLVFSTHQLFRAPPAATAARQLAERSLEKGQIHRSKDLLKQALRADVPQTETHRLSAEVHYALGDFSEATLHYGHWLSVEGYSQDPMGALRACQAALYAGQTGLALQWADRLLATTGQGHLAPDAALVKAKALNQQGKAAAAEKCIEELLSGPAAGPVRAKALAFKATQLLQQYQYGQALQHLEASLETAEQDPANRRSTLAALARLHTTLATQDRNTLDNLKAAQGYLERFTAMALEGLQYPAGPESAHWLEKNLAPVYDAAVQCSYLMAQYEPDSRAGELAFKWIESAKMLAALLEEQKRDTSAAFWQYRWKKLEMRNSPPARVQPKASMPTLKSKWENQRQANQATLRYSLSHPRPLVDFRAALGESNGVAFHYYLTGPSLFVLRVSSTELQLYQTKLDEQRWPFGSETSRAETVQREAARKLFFPGLERAISQAKQVVVFPTGELLSYPFAAVEVAGTPLGAKLPVYLHHSASAYIADLENQSKLPAPGGSLLLLHKSERGADADAVAAMPTSKQGFQDCTALMRKWVLRQPGGSIASLPAVGKASLLVLPSAQALPDLTHQLNAQPAGIRHLWIQSPDEVKHPPALLYTLLRLQQHHVGLIRVQLDGCEKTTFTHWMEQAQQAANPLKGLQTLEAVRPTGFFFGAPLTAPSRTPSSIPVLWILAGVAAMILAGLWVKR